MRTGYLRRGRDVTAGRQPSRGAVQWWILRELPAGRREEQLREHYPPLAASATLLSCQFEPPARDRVPSQPTRINAIARATRLPSTNARVRMGVTTPPYPDRAKRDRSHRQTPSDGEHRISAQARPASPPGSGPQTTVEAGPMRSPRPAVRQREIALVCLTAADERIPRHIIVATIPRTTTRWWLLCRYRRGRSRWPRWRGRRERPPAPRVRRRPDRR